MMEVEDVHAYQDADMMPDEGAVDYSDHIMQDDHPLVAIPEVEMDNDAVDEAIEYDMEDATVHVERAEEDATVPSVSVDPSNSVEPLSGRLQTPPPTEILKADVVFESPSSVRNSEPAAVPEENRIVPAEPPNVVAATDPSDKPEANSTPVITPEIPATVSEIEPTVDSIPSEVTEVAEHSEEREGHEAPSNELTAQEEDKIPQIADAAPDLPAEETDPSPDETSTEYYPSPVLISNSTASHPSFYLFVAPESSPDELVYLADQPQLFYEPLHAVFEAIRGLAEEVGIPEHVELALYSDALDLNVSEDNIYTREVSLNDLNILHIGCELEGPLSLRLDQNSPRFILRYRAILAELHRVSSEGEGAETNIDQDPNPVSDEQVPLQNGPQEEEEAPADEDTSAEAKILPSSLPDAEHPSHTKDPTQLSSFTDREANADEVDTINPTTTTTGPIPETHDGQELNASAENSQTVTPTAMSPTSHSNQHKMRASFNDRLQSSEPDGNEPGHIKTLADIDTSSVAPSEGVPAFKVTFDVSDLDDEANDNSSVLDDETQTTKFFESQLNGSSLIFNTQDGVDTEYYPNQYANEDDEADAYAADLEQENPIQVTSRPTVTDQTEPEVSQDYDDENHAEGSQVPRSPTAELWGDEPDELLFYDENEGEDQEYNEFESLQGENNQQSLYDDVDEYPLHEADADGEEDYPEPDAADENTEQTEDPPVLTAHTESPVIANKAAAPPRSFSSLSSKRSFDDTENLEHKPEVKRVKTR